ncbi:hypothetical protein Taro_054025, partial [Colocasia esculenta]|nr:hypothetical protein [Colocasia esculenta]
VLVVGGTNTSRHTGPQLVLFQCLTLASPGQGLWRCQAWACDRVVRARRTSHDRRPAQGRVVAVQGQYLQRSSSSCVRARRTSHDRRPAQGRVEAVQGQYLQWSSSSCVVLQQCSFVVAYFL